MRGIPAIFGSASCQDIGGQDAPGRRSYAMTSPTEVVAFSAMKPPGGSRIKRGAVAQVVDVNGLGCSGGQLIGRAQALRRATDRPRASPQAVATLAASSSAPGVLALARSRQRSYPFRYATNWSIRRSGAGVKCRPRDRKSVV